MELRALQTRDIFKMSKIISKMNLLEKFKGLFQSTEGKSEEEVNAMQKEIGLEFFYHIFANIHLAEQDINEFFGGLIGKSAEEFASQPPAETMELIKGLSSQPGFGDFLKLVAKSNQ